MDIPPSTNIAVPVVKLEASEARYSADCAISSGNALLFKACILFTNSITSGESPNSFAIGVSVPPGNKAFTQMALVPYSLAKDLVKPTNPALLAEYEAI